MREDLSTPGTHKGTPSLPSGQLQETNFAGLQQYVSLKMEMCGADEAELADIT